MRDLAPRQDFIDANARDGSISMRVRATICPSRIFFDTITSDHPVAGADAIGMIDNPMRQEIWYNQTVGKLVTFWGDGSLKYALEGASTVTTINEACTIKPGVGATKIYTFSSGADEPGTLTRWLIDWNDIAARSTSPLTYEDSIVTDYPSVAVHYIDESSCMVIGIDNGGFRPEYVTGTTPHIAPRRFMFPSARDWSGSSRTMAAMGIFSGGIRHYTGKAFVYMSNAAKGTVEGMYYDTNTETWSDIFTVVPTDLDTSLCEFRIANVYTHNGAIYMAGMFHRTEIFGDEKYYTLILRSTDGINFSVDRNVLVSDIGYRFLAFNDDQTSPTLYLANCNRVCYTASTWPFEESDGLGVNTLVTGDDILSFNDRSLETASLVLRSGLEQYFDHPNLIEGARVIVEVGLQTASSDMYTKYATYILKSVSHERAAGQRGTVLNLVNEGQWLLSEMSMPFYAEIMGKSTIFDPLLPDDNGHLYGAVGIGRTNTSFMLDFWKHEGYSDNGQGITPVEISREGGVGYYVAADSHIHGIITNDTIKNLYSLVQDPVITATTINIYIRGWSHATSTGQVNDEVHAILVTADASGAETVHYSGGTPHWDQTYPDIVSGTTPISTSFTGLTVGHTIKKIGVWWYAPNTTWFYISRVDIRDGVKITFQLDDTGMPWEKMEAGGNSWFQLPKKGRPYVMFCERPYNAFDFSISAKFYLDAYNCVTGYPAAAGLVGHGNDGANFTVGRFNRTNGKAEIVKVRDGVETVLASATPSFTVEAECQYRFDHKGGHFELFIEDIGGSSILKKVVEYDWNKTTDGFMFTSVDATMKTGIYGYLGGPVSRTFGYYAGTTEGEINAEGIPIDPHWAVTDFPASGKVRINDNTYSYTSLIHHTVGWVNGPYQYLKTFAEGTTYGIEVAEQNYAAPADTYNGALIAIDNGANFICSNITWQLSTPDRARYESTNQQIAVVYGTQTNKVYITGGFNGVALIAGDNIGQPEGSWVEYQVDGNGIKCYWFNGAGGEQDLTVQRLISTVCGLAGTRCDFPGNYTAASLALGNPSDILSVPYAESFDIEFDTASPLSFRIIANVGISLENWDVVNFSEPTWSKVVVEHMGSGVFRYNLESDTGDGANGNELYYPVEMQQSTGVQHYRISYLGNNVTVYHNQQWVATWCHQKLIYPVTLQLKGYGGITISNVVIHELSDARDAINIDLETDGRSALSSVIQQRPIEVTLKTDGSLSYWYERTRDAVTAVREPWRHKWTYIVPSGGASDAIVQSAEEVKILQNAAFAKRLGFSTKLFRMSDLYNGAYRAANLILRKAYETFYQHDITLRPDVRLMPGDLYTMSYTASGTGASEAHDIILETVDLSIQAQDKKVSVSMQLTGRENQP